MVKNKSYDRSHQDFRGRSNFGDNRNRGDRRNFRNRERYMTRDRSRDRDNRGRFNRSRKVEEDQPLKTKSEERRYLYYREGREFYKGML